MKNILTLLTIITLAIMPVAYGQVTSSTGQYEDNYNLLGNPSFESGVKPWVITGAIPSAFSGEKFYGDRSLRLVMASQTLDAKIISTKNATALASLVPGFFYFRAKTNVAVKVCLIEAGVVSNTFCITTASDNNWRSYRLTNITLGPTSNGLSIATTGPVTGTAHIDTVFLGATPAARASSGPSLPLETYKASLVNGAILPLYDWSAPLKLSDPTIAPSSGVSSVSWSTTNEWLAMGVGISPFINIYQRAGDLFSRIPNPAGLPLGDIRSLSWSPNSDFLAGGHGTSPYLVIYQRSGSTFTKLANVATLPANAGNGVAFSPNSGEYLAVAHTASPFLSIYQRTANAVFTKIANPTLPVATSAANTVSWSPDAKHLVVGHDTTPFFEVYERAGSTFTKLSAPTIKPTTMVLSSSYSPDGKYLLLTGNATSSVNIYRRNGNTYTKVADPIGGYPNTSGHQIFGSNWHPSGEYFCITSNASPYLWIYSVAGEVFTKITDVATPPPIESTSCSWSPNAKHLAVGHYGASNVNIYSTSSGEPTTLNAVPNVLGMWGF
jgi:hypothetical protein